MTKLTSVQLGLLDEIGDSLFDGSMKADASALGDNGVTQDDGSFQPDWDSTFLKDIHGVALITGDSRDTTSEQLADVKDIFSDSITEIATLIGDVRPGDNAGHEQ
jgi:hypothetical protein